MSTDPQTIVESYHINVGLGDSAIHVLGKQVNASKRELISAVLIDGGLSSDYGVQNLSRTIREIEERYGITGKLQFRSVVITHWDADHWQGINDLIEREEDQIKDGQYSRFFYETDTQTNKVVCLTTIYAPNIPAEKKEGKTRPQTKEERKEEKERRAKEKVEMNKAKKQGKKLSKKKKERQPRKKAEMTPCKKGEMAIVSDGAMKPSYHFEYNDKPLAVAKIGEIIIGYDFFTNKKPCSDNFDTIQTLDQLLGPNPAAAGMYCLASNLGIIGLKARPSKPQHGVRDGLLLVMPTVTNQQSIAAVIVWSNKHISHYSAGDLDFYGEVLLSAWLSKNYNANVGSPYNITCIKSSHHGARNSNPPRLYWEAKPKHIIFSVSSHYGHPAWETIVMLQAYHARQKTNYPQLEFEPLCSSTCYPYWLENIHTNEGIYQEKINIDVLRIDEAISKLPAQRKKQANHLAKVFEDLFKDAPGVINLRDDIRKECASDNANDNEAIFEQVAIGVMRHASGLFRNLWKWDMDDGSILDDVVYIRLILSDKIAVDGEIETVTKERPRDPKKAKKETVVIQSPPKQVITVTRNPDKGTSERLTEKRQASKLSRTQTKAAEKKKQAKRRAKVNANPPPPAKSIESSKRLNLLAKRSYEASSKFQSFMVLNNIALGPSIRADPVTGPEAKYPFSIWSSSYATSPEAQAESVDGAILEPDDWLDDFLLTMRPSAIHLKSHLAGGWLLLHPDDFLGRWIRTAFAGSELAFNQEGPEFRIVTPQGFVFSTKGLVEALGTDGKFSPSGLSQWFDNATMVLGLDPGCQPVANGWTTKDILALFPTDPESPIDPASRTLSIVSDSLFGIKWALDPKLSAGKRNAVWLTPISNYHSTLRLAFVPEKDETNPISDFFGQFFSTDGRDKDAVVDLSNVQLIYRKSCVLNSFGSENSSLISNRSLILSAIMTIQAPKPEDATKERAKVSPAVSLDLVDTGALTLNLITTDRKGNFTAVASAWVSKLFPAFDLGLQTFKDQNISDDFYFRKLTIELSPDRTISHASVSIEVNAKLGQSAGAAKNLPIYFEAKYSNRAGQKGDWSISGNLWLGMIPELPLKIFSDYEEFWTLQPLTPDPLEVLELTTLFSSMSQGATLPDLPKGIPNAITAAGFRVTRNSIFVNGTITNCNPTAEDGKVPALRFGEVDVEADWNWTRGVASIRLSFFASLSLPDWYEPPEGCAANSLIGSLSYKTGGQWSIAASVRDLNLGMLYELFPSNVRDTLFQLLKGIRVVDVSVTYDSAGSGQGSALVCEGSIMIGEIVSLDLNYTSQPDGTWWFNASLAPCVEVIKPVTLGDIISSFIDSSDTNLLANLPEFLTETVIIGGTDSDPELELSVENDDSIGPKLVITARIMGFEVEFVQIKVASDEDPKDETAAPKGGKILRLFKAVLTKIPMPESVPILDHIEQPFDELGFFWINQSVTREELAALDDEVEMPDESSDEDPSPSAEASKDKSASGMRKGFHFVIISSGKVVLDYPIGKVASEAADKPAAEKPEKPDESGSVPPKDPDKEDQQVADPKQSSKSSYKNTLGPLNITQIGFRYEDGTLAILMDATIAFGPVALDMMGFTFGLHFKASDGTFKNLKSLSWHDVRMSISGLGIQYAKPPLTIAGAFLHEQSADSDMYVGGLTVGFAAWLFQAAGFYGVIGKKGDVNSYKCLFAYAMIRGPIMNIAGFAELSGLTGGFGYNVDLTLPTMDNVTSFPLLSPGDESAPPSQLVRTLIPGGGERGPFFNPLNGAMFVAAGITVTAFQMLEMTALVAVQWSPRVQIALLGLAKCDVPSIKSPVKFAHIELGIVATVDLDACVMKVEAQLSPNSWIIHQDCHLTGGFALYYWFGAGRTDWVLTIGGYHSAFIVPAHYPKPDRLRISWTIDSSLSVMGEAYFAVTPKACMGGLRIRTALSLGALYAWFDAAADFLIMYAPFYFMADVKISVGVRFSMDVWFVTVRIAVELSASLALKGPPLHGIVHVDFWVFGFDIAFGDDGHGKNTEGISFEKFWELVTQAESSSAGTSVGGKDAHLFSCTKGLVTKNQAEAKARDPWIVRSGMFQFTIECQFAVESVSVNKENAPKPEGVAIENIYAKPMQLKEPISSVLEVEIVGPSGSKSEGWRATPAWKDVPRALWGEYNQSEDPTAPGTGNSVSSLLDTKNSMARLLMGVVIEAPIPKISLDTIPAYRVDEAMKKNIFNQGKEPQFPVIDKEEDTFAPVKREANDKRAWEALKTAWNEAPLPKSAVDIWQDVFGTSGLSGTKPTDLINHTNVLFLSAPLLGKVY